MAATIIRITLVIMFTLFIHRGAYPPAPSPSRRPVREYIEVGILVVCLLIIPYLRFNLLWYSGWLSAYLIFGLLAPPVMEIMIRRRPLSVVGFRMPTNRRAMAIVAGILILYLSSRLIEPLIQGEALNFNLRGFFSNSILFAFLEEALFRGLIQTRLESTLGAV
jgi:membrane protease YdiL (CAAX protease family)